jgi:hypothetical protein
MESADKNGWGKIQIKRESKMKGKHKSERADNKKTGDMGI